MVSLALGAAALWATVHFGWKGATEETQKQILTSIEEHLKPLESVGYQQLVGNIMKALHPKAEVKIGTWIMGPDGRRSIDVEIRGIINGVAKVIGIECLDMPNSKKAGVEVIDAFDSKRGDLGIDEALICSNTGFDPIALRKAKRKRIGAISVLKRADSRIKSIIEEEIYTRKIRVSSIDSTFHFTDRQNFSALQERRQYPNLLFEDKPFVNWIMRECAMLVWDNYRTETLSVEYKFRQPIKLTYQAQSFMVQGYELKVSYKTKWYSQLVVIDASLGLYDYLAKTVRLGSGGGQYIMQGVNFDLWQPLDFIPGENDIGFQSMNPNSIRVLLSLVEGVDLSADPANVPDVDRFVANKKVLPHAAN